MMEIRLSDKQKEIVEANDGAFLVLASAGSGKTRVLTERVRYLITSKPGKFKILALTFTNKAAEEMQLRLKNISEIQDRTFIGTIHKFCLELIRSKGSTIGLSEMPHIFEREADRMEVLLEVFENNPVLKTYLDNQEEAKRKKYLYDVLNFISQKKKYLFGLVESNEKVDEESNLLFNEYNSVLSSQNAIDFDDVICLAYKIFIERPKVAELYRKMYKYICIDEAQDLNFAQYELIRVLCGEDHRNILMVGDPNQAIYGFNGSDKLFMTKTFPEDFNATTITLSENYRSSKSVLNAANKLIPNSVEVSNAVIKGEFEIKACDDEADEARWIVQKVSSFLSDKRHSDIEGQITLDSIAILARNRYIFQNVEIELSKNSIPFFIKKTNDFSEYESDIVKTFDLGTRLLINTVDKLHYQQLCNIIGISIAPLIDSSNGLDKLVKTEGLITDNAIREDFKILINAWQLINSNINNFLKAIQIITDYIDISDDYSDNLDKKSLVIQDLEDFKEAWMRYSLESQADSKTLSSFRNQIALGIPAGNNKRNSGITLGTIHSVKGLEFDIVFLMGMNEGTFPDYRAVRNGSSALNEEKNNAFVAITRSKRLLYITYPKQKFMPWDKSTPAVQRPSRYIALISS